MERTNKTLDTKGFHNFGSSNSKGVSILISNQIDYSIIDQHKDNEGRIIILNIEIDKKIFTLVNVYAPNLVRDRNSFFKKLNNLIDKTRLGILLLGGDFNDILSTRDTKSTKCKKSEYPVYGLKKLIKNYKLLDIWRIKHQSLQQYSWKRKNSAKEGSRIDYFFNSNGIKPISKLM